MTQFTIEDFRHRAWRTSHDAHLIDAGDFSINPDVEDAIRKNAIVEAAVMIGVLDASDGPRVLMTERTKKLRAHSGQIAFPGGRADRSDRTMAETAMRETFEETGIAPDHIELVGQLPLYLSGSGYRIQPILGIINGDYQIAPNEDEVASIFDVPLEFLMRDKNHKIGTRQMNGRQRHFYEMPYENWYIWGVTAGILRVMYERLYR